MFAFRQFSVDDSRSAMKVGTDAVILGTYAGISQATRILDIGTGCGVIALLLAQRFPQAAIEGIEIDADSAHQAMENVLRSPFSEKIKIYHTALQDFLPADTYQHIASNPPFFERSLASPKPTRRRARHQETMTNDELISFAANYLTEDGVFSVIIPYQTEKGFLQKANSFSLHLQRRLLVSSRPGKPIRCVLELSKTRKDPAVDELTIEKDDGTRSEKYSMLTKNFYIGL